MNHITETWSKLEYFKTLHDKPWKSVYEYLRPTIFFLKLRGPSYGIHKYVDWLEEDNIQIVDKAKNCKKKLWNNFPSKGNGIYKDTL